MMMVIIIIIIIITTKNTNRWSILIFKSAANLMNPLSLAYLPLLVVQKNCFTLSQWHKGSTAPESDCDCDSPNDSIISPNLGYNEADTEFSVLLSFSCIYKYSEGLHGPHGSDGWMQNTDEDSRRESSSCRRKDGRVLVGLSTGHPLTWGQAQEDALGALFCVVWGRVLLYLERHKRRPNSRGWAAF